MKRPPWAAAYGGRNRNRGLQAAADCGRTPAGKGIGLFALSLNSTVMNTISRSPRFSEIMNLEFAFSVGFMPRFARLVGVFDRSAVVHMLASATAGYRGPKIIKDMAMEANTFAGARGG